ncbi:hypothetical protein T751_00114 [Klebsiella phage T751]|nr:hypothetical protein K751_00044 [Klebsiella phage K751]URG13676.1 hypothetical protein T751_00114 [Klebsiella phage T751]URG17996.1 hypothetical protein T765_00158 [Klebsiella phage T765]
MAQIFLGKTEFSQQMGASGLVTIPDHNSELLPLYYTEDSWTYESKAYQSCKLFPVMSDGKLGKPVKVSGPLWVYEGNAVEVKRRVTYEVKIKS